MCEFEEAISYILESALQNWQVQFNFKDKKPWGYNHFYNMDDANIYRTLFGLRQSN